MLPEHVEMGGREKPKANSRITSQILNMEAQTANDHILSGGP